MIDTPLANSIQSWLIAGALAFTGLIDRDFTSPRDAVISGGKGRDLLSPLVTNEEEATQRS